MWEKKAFESHTSSETAETKRKDKAKFDEYIGDSVGYS